MAAELRSVLEQKRHLTWYYFRAARKWRGSGTGGTISLTATGYVQVNNIVGSGDNNSLEALGGPQGRAVKLRSAQPVLLHFRSAAAPSEQALWHLR